jgi:hypothetical protein
MTAAIIRIPVSDATVARLTKRQSARHVAEEREELLATAREVMARPDRFTAQDLRASCIFAQNHGDGVDHMRADELLFALNKRERIERNRQAAILETPAQIARQHRSEWPLIILGGMACAVVWLAGSGWL